MELFMPSKLDVAHGGGLSVNKASEEDFQPERPFNRYNALMESKKCPLRSWGVGFVAEEHLTLPTNRRECVERGSSHFEIEFGTNEDLHEDYAETIAEKCQVVHLSSE